MTVGGVAAAYNYYARHPELDSGSVINGNQPNESANIMSARHLESSQPTLILNQVQNDN